MYSPIRCNICPRNCGADRTKVPGYCLGGDTIKMASASPHFGEERCISGQRGSGTVFFTGCSLRCVFCQNHRLRDASVGRAVTVETLADIFLDLQHQRVHNLNLVTPTHYRPWIQAALAKAKERGFSLPMVWNTSGYETLESIRSLWDDVDVWLYDLKFFSPLLSQKAAGAPDYFEVAFQSLQAAIQQTGPPKFAADGTLRQGVVVRMLVLPNHEKDAVELLSQMAEAFPVESIVLSLMRQYAPPAGIALPEFLNRRLTFAEYQTVRAKAISLGFASDYFQ